MYHCRMVVHCRPALTVSRLETSFFELQDIARQQGLARPEFAAEDVDSRSLSPGGLQGLARGQPTLAIPNRPAQRTADEISYFLVQDRDVLLDRDIGPLQPQGDKFQGSDIVLAVRRQPQDHLVSLSSKIGNYQRAVNRLPSPPDDIAMAERLFGFRQPSEPLVGVVVRWSTVVLTSKRPDGSVPSNVVEVQWKKLVTGGSKSPIRAT